MANIGTMIHRRTVITTCCWVVMGACPEDGYHWWCATHCDGGTEPSAVEILATALGHAHARINDDLN